MSHTLEITTPALNARMKQADRRRYRVTTNAGGQMKTRTLPEFCKYAELKWGTVFARVKFWADGTYTDKFETILIAIKQHRDRGKYLKKIHVTCTKCGHQMTQQEILHSKRRALRARLPLSHLMWHMDPAHYGETLDEFNAAKMAAGGEPLPVPKSPSEPTEWDKAMARVRKAEAAKLAAEAVAQELSHDQPIAGAGEGSARPSP